MEQIGDVIERVLQDVEDKKIRKNRSFSEAGLAEISHLHERLLANLRLGMSVFLDGHVRDAKKLLEEKARFRDLEREVRRQPIARLQDNTAQSIETSSLAPRPDQRPQAHQLAHLLDRLPHPLDSAGVLSQTRIRNWGAGRTAGGFPAAALSDGARRRGARRGAVRCAAARLVECALIRAAATRRWIPR